MSKIKNAIRPVIAYIKALARDDFGCRVYFDTMWDNKTHRRYLRIKGRRAHEPALVNVVKEKFPDARVYMSKEWGWGSTSISPVPAISITIPRIDFEGALINCGDLPTRRAAMKQYAQWMRAVAYPEFEEDRVIRRFRLMRATKFKYGAQLRDLGLYTITFKPYVAGYEAGYYLITPEVETDERA